MQQGADALVLGRRRVGADIAEAPVRVVGARGPDLLAVDHELVTIEHGPGGEAGQVTAGPGLAHAEAPGQLALQGGQRPPLDLGLGAVVEQRGRHDGQALGVHRPGDVPVREDLEVDHLLDRRGVAPTPRRGEPGDQPPAVEEGALPPLGPLLHVGTGAAADPLLGRGWRVLLQPGQQLGPERLVLVGVPQPHRANLLGAGGGERVPEVGAGPLLGLQVRRLCGGHLGAVRIPRPGGGQ